jgi:hypothetical protein
LRQGSTGRPRQHHNGQRDAVERFRQVKNIADPIGAVDRHPGVNAFDTVEDNSGERDHKPAERCERGQQTDDERASCAELHTRHQPLHDPHRRHAAVLQRADQHRVPGSVEELVIAADRKERADRHAIERERSLGRVRTQRDEG